MPREHDQYRVWRHQQGTTPLETTDHIAREEPLEIRVAGRGVGITMRTPGHDEDLALGFLVGEGLLNSPADVEHVRNCDRPDSDLVDVIVAPGVAVDFAALTRHVFASSSCGVCGSATIDAVRRAHRAAHDGPVIAGSILHGLADKLRAAQPTFEKTGGLHGAALFDARGELLLAREDVGRHNAVDKIVGHAFREGLLPLSHHILLVSGRASFEIVQKALAAGVGIVAAISAPSSLAVDLALESNITLVGFLRPGRFNVHSHPERIAQ